MGHMATVAGSTTAATVGTKVSILAAPVPRLVSVDILRGLVMVTMALDHTRDFMSYLRFPPEDMVHTYGALFFTRFITHFCAPVFFFLAGTGAWLATSRGKSLQQVSWFFLTRGLWLVILELTVVDFGWGFVAWAFAGVLWALGWSMVAMALIVRLPVRWIAALGVGMIATHNLVDRIDPASLGKFYWLLMILHTPGRVVGRLVHSEEKNESAPETPTGAQFGQPPAQFRSLSYYQDGGSYEAGCYRCAPRARVDARRVWWRRRYLR
jgi:uncharacterized membrane protein